MRSAGGRPLICAEPNRLSSVRAGYRVNVQRLHHEGHQEHKVWFSTAEPSLDPRPRVECAGACPRARASRDPGGACSLFVYFVSFVVHLPTIQTIGLTRARWLRPRASSPAWARARPSAGPATARSCASGPGPRDRAAGAPVPSSPCARRVRSRWNLRQAALERQAAYDRAVRRSLALQVVLDDMSS